MLRKFALALLAPLLLATVALADGPLKRDRIGVPYAAGTEEPFKWTGLYLDVGGGHAWTSSELSHPFFNVDSVVAQGWRGDGRVGFDVSLGSNFVAGFFGGYGFGSSEFDVSVKGTEVLSAKLTPTWHAGSRVGVNAGKTLWYVGAAWQQAELSVNGSESTLDGIKALGGMEAYVAPQLTLGLEVGHTWYEEQNLGPVRVEPTDLEALVRLKWRPTTGFFN